MAAFPDRGLVPRLAVRFHLVQNWSTAARERRFVQPGTEPRRSGEGGRCSITCCRKRGRWSSARPPTIAPPTPPTTAQPVLDNGTATAPVVAPAASSGLSVGGKRKCKEGRREPLGFELSSEYLSVEQEP